MAATYSVLLTAALRLSVKEHSRLGGQNLQLYPEFDNINQVSIHQSQCGLGNTVSAMVSFRNSYHT